MVDPPFIQGYDDFWPLYVSIKTDFYKMALESGVPCEPYFISVL